MVGAGGGDGGDHGQAECGSQLQGGVEQPGRESGLVCGYAGVGGDGDQCLMSSVVSELTNLVGMLTGLVIAPLD
jgi:hypothetical protein